MRVQGPQWTQARSLLPLRAALSPIPKSGRAEAQDQLVEPSKGHLLSPLLPRNPCYQTTCPRTDSVPTKPSRPESVKWGRRRRLWTPPHRSGSRPLKMDRWRRKALRTRTPSTGTGRRERTRQRDGGGPATEAETNGAPGERDRQEILLNQDTAPNVIAVITISSM